MEPIQNNSFVSPTPSPIQPIQPKLKKSIFIRVLRILGIAIGSYIVIGLVLIMINPLFAFLVLYPYFVVQDFLGQNQRVALENKLDNIPKSEIILPMSLTQSDCVGLLFTEDFRNLNNPRVVPYVEKLKPGRFDNIGVCTTLKGNFVIKTSSPNGADLAEIYKDSDGELIKLFEIGNIVFEFTEDEKGTVFLLVPKNTENGVTREALVYSESDQTFLKVADTADTVKVCQKENLAQCTEWKLKNISVKAVANYNPAQQEEEYKTANPPKTKTAPQLQCIKEFNKESERSSGNLGNIKLPIDLSSEPLFSCITNKTQRPFDFDLYLASSPGEGQLSYNPYFAYFQTTRNDRVISYHISYGGFDVFNYALDSVSYQIFKNLISEKYKVGELIPQLDNNEAGWAGFNPHSPIISVEKTMYKNIDIYTIKSGTRFKAFLLGKTYILIRYDSHLNAAISEEDAIKAVKSIIDSTPYVPAPINSFQ